jgi:membrane-bound serine protease (ClpP class)
VKTKQVAEGGKTKLQPLTTPVFSSLPVQDQLFHTVASPPAAYLLLVIGLSLIIFEFFTAGAGVAGLVGAGCLVLSCYGLATLPVRPWALALLVLAMFGFAVDVQTGVPRAWSVIGLVSLVVGSIWLFDGFSLSWITLLVGIAGTAMAMVSGMPAMVRTRFSTPTIGREWMIGEEGEAVTKVDPDGVVRGPHQPGHADRPARRRAGGRGRRPAPRGRAPRGRRGRLPRPGAWRRRRRRLTFCRGNARALARVADRAREGWGLCTPEGGSTVAFHRKGAFW